jgi:hypothetical protein
MGAESTSSSTAATRLSSSRVIDATAPCASVQNGHWFCTET